MKTLDPVTLEIHRTSRGVTGQLLLFVTMPSRLCSLRLPYRWRQVIVAAILIAVLYGITVTLIDHAAFKKTAVLLRGPFLQDGRRANPKIVANTGPAFELTYRKRKLFCDSILTLPEAESLASRVTIDPKLLAASSPKKIYSTSTGLGEENLGGCPDWKCKFTHSGDEADIVIAMSGGQLPKNRSPDALLVYYSQESPMHSSGIGSEFNFTFGYRHDSPAASPYGYAVKLAEKSRLPASTPVIDDALVAGKTKAAAWFVSHCNTISLREKLVEKLQAYVQIDVFGACSKLKCAKGTDCENDIDKVYHFYMALENSICDDYNTEKLWNQGYSHYAIPIVLKRSNVENYVPPGSFIAFDDYKDLEEMGAHLNELMDDKNAYKKYFDWRRDYEVIYLDGQRHDERERPWGVCQICRTAHLHAAGKAATLPFMNNTDLPKRWSESCEQRGGLAEKLLNA